MRSFSVRPARLILVPSAPSHTPFYLSVPHHPRQPSSHTPFYLFVPHHPRQPLQSHALVPFHFIQHLIPPLRFFSPCPRPPGKVPGFSAKTVHFPPRPAGAPAPQASLAALAVSPSRESAGNFGENGSLSPVAGRGAGSTGLSRGTWHFHLPGKCLDFPRKRFTFPRGRQGRWLHRPLWPHLAFPPLGKVPGISAKTVHFPPVADRDTGSTCLSGGTCHFHPWGKCRVFPRKRFTFPRGRQGRWLHRPLSRHSPFPPLGKVPGFSTKTVHFPPWPAGVPALQASLAALAVSPSRESAGNFGENGSLSPMA